MNEKYDVILVEKEIIDKKVKRMEAQVKTELEEKIRLNDEVDDALADKETLYKEKETLYRSVRALKTEMKDNVAQTNHIKAHIDELEQMQRKYDLKRLKKRRNASSSSFVGKLTPFSNFMDIKSTDQENKWQCEISNNDQSKFFTFHSLLDTDLLWFSY